MLRPILGALGLLSLVPFTIAQSNSTSTSNVAAQYGDTFKNIGGPVLSGQINAYVIFYGDWTQSDADNAQTTFLDFVSKVSTTQWYSQFNDYVGSSSLQIAAAMVDSGSQGLTLNGTSSYEQIVNDAIQSGYLSLDNSIDNNGVYIILGGQNVVDSAFCVTSCGFNGYSNSFQYMYIGDASTCPDKCLPQQNIASSPNGNPAIDAAITIFSHEIQDVITDPRGNAWVINSQVPPLELGDFCAGANVDSSQWFGTVSQVGGGNNASYNLEINDKKYLVQTIFNLGNKTCSL